MVTSPSARRLEALPTPNFTDRQIFDPTTVAYSRFKAFSKAFSSSSYRFLTVSKNRYRNRRRIFVKINFSGTGFSKVRYSTPSSSREFERKKLPKTVVFSCEFERKKLPIIVGAGPSGLAASACLEQSGVPSLVLEKSNCIASLWQHRTYDRLKLHLPKQFCELPLMGFPQNFPTYPSKLQFIEYMEAYALKFSIKPKFGQSVISATFDSECGLWRVRTKEIEYICRWLIVATGENAEPVIPNIPGIEKFHGRVLHTSAYKAGEDFRQQKVLIVGCGNSGMEVSLDLCNHNASPYMVVRDSSCSTKRDVGYLYICYSYGSVKVVPSENERCGLRRPKTGPMELKNRDGKTPVLDVGALSQVKNGKIKVMPGVKEITRTGARFMDWQEQGFHALVLATGYKCNTPYWLKDHVLFGDDGMPKTRFPNGWKGENGLYCVGFTRRGLLGSGADAMKIAEDISQQWKKLTEYRFLLCKKMNKRT